MVPFQCETCHFRNIFSKDPNMRITRHLRTLLKFRRCSLDAFWAFETGEMFPAWFASVALCFGVASVVNARMVERLGMRYLTWRAIIGLSICSILFLVVTLAHDGVPPFWTFILWLAPTFFFVSIAFANMNAMAMEPVGHMAGLGAALIGCGATLVSLPLGWLVGDSYAGGITALIAGFAVLGTGSVLTMWLTEKKQSVA